MNISALGLHTEAIENAVDTAESLWSDAVEAFREYELSEKDEMRFATISISDNAVEIMKENFDVENMTASIINAYYDSVKAAIHESDIAQKMNIFITSYTNDLDSHLYINVGNEQHNTSQEYISDSGTNGFSSALKEAYAEMNADKIHEMINSFLPDNKEYMYEWVQEDMRTVGGEIDFISEFNKSIEKGELTNVLKNYVKEYAIDCVELDEPTPKKEKNNKAVERD